MQTTTVQQWMNRQRVKATGMATVYIQIIIERKHKEIPTGVDWPPQFFDRDKKTIVKRQKKDADYDSAIMAIDTMRLKALNAIRRLHYNEMAITLQSVLDEMNLEGKRGEFISYMRNKMEKRYAKCNILKRTWKNHRNTLCVLEREFPKLTFREMDDLFLQSFKSRLSALAPNTKWGHIKTIRAYLKLAEEDKIIINQQHKRFKNGNPHKTLIFLEKDELKALENLRQQNLTPEQLHILHAFLFASFTGLRISDLLLVNHSWLSGDFLVFNPRKGILRHKKELRIPLLSIAKKYIINVKGNFFTLPTEQEFNRVLKDLAAMAGLKKNLTAHVARHTCGTLMAENGIPVQVIAQVLGHSKIQTSMIYIHVTDKTASKEMQKMESVL